MEGFRGIHNCYTSLNFTHKYWTDLESFNSWCPCDSVRSSCGSLCNRRAAWCLGPSPHCRRSTPRVDGAPDRDPSGVDDEGFPVDRTQGPCLVVGLSVWNKDRAM